METKVEKIDEILKEARRLHDIGFGVHWIKPNSKKPVKSGWTEPEREDWESLCSSYYKGYGLGIRLGSPSHLESGFLAVLDMDIRSPNPRYLKEATAVIDQVHPGLRHSAPMVSTGRGYGSAHFYILRPAPEVSQNLGRSSEMVKVYSPTSEISGEQERYVKNGKLTSKELKDGYRMKSAWEVDFMCAGKQVVAPPTQHPDTKTLYVWAQERGLE